MKIKGVVVQARREFVEKNFPAGSWERVLAALEPADREVVNGILFASQWFPFDVGTRLDKAIVDVLGGGDMRTFEAIGAQSAKKNLAEAHQGFLTPGDPQLFMKRTEAIYRFYYDTGHRTYEETGPNSGVMTTYEAETFSAVDCLTVIGWYKEALRMCGAKNVDIVEEECRARGGAFCRYRVQWEM